MEINRKKGLKIRRVHRFLIFLCGLFFIQTTEGLSANKLQSVFGDHVCIPGTVHYTQSGASLVKTDSDYNYATVTKEEMAKAMETEVMFSDNKHPVSIIHEICILNRIKSTYFLISEEGPPHDKLFTIELRLGDETYTAQGKSFKDAKLHAAIEAIISTKYALPPNEKKHKSHQLPPMTMIQNLGTQYGIKVEYIELTKEEYEATEGFQFRSHNLFASDKPRTVWQELNDTGTHKNQTGVHVPVGSINRGGQFYVRLLIGGRQYYGKGLSKAWAKNEAALNALEDFKYNPLLESSQDELMENRRSLVSAVGKINELGQKLQIPVKFELTSSGPEHEKLFQAVMTFDKFQAEGKGPSKKKAKQNCAENMLEILKGENLGLLIRNGDLRGNDLSENDLSGNDEVKGSNEHLNHESKIQRKMKRSKRKKPKIIKTRFDQIRNKVEDIFSTASDWLFPKVEDESAKKKHDSSKDDRSKEQDWRTSKMKLKTFLLGKNAHMHFRNVKEKSADGLHMSLLTVDVNPPYVCLGEGASYDDAQEMASLGMLKNFQIFGLDKIHFDPSAKYQGKQILDVLWEEEGQAFSEDDSDQEDLVLDQMT